MKKEKKESIGNGGHWEVSRITSTENGLIRSIIHKEPLRNQSPDKNISNYKLIKSCGLPTLSKFAKLSLNKREIIEAEDLNPKNCDGLYVSPNTVRNAPNCSSIFAKYLRDNTLKIPHECQKFNIDEYLKHPESISKDLEELRKTLILKGAEKYVYENKIKTISNFKKFLINSKADMKKAANNQIELFTDVFFFRVSESTKKIDYKIADFDCINHHNKSSSLYKILMKGNLDYFETALTEFIEWFVENNQQDKYLSEIKNVW